jgi:small-conductance mechanosensitive channel
MNIKTLFTLGLLFTGVSFASDSSNGDEISDFDAISSVDTEVPDVSFDISSSTPAQPDQSAPQQDNSDAEDVVESVTPPSQTPPPPQDTTVKDLIKQLESDTSRQDLLKTLKALDTNLSAKPDLLLFSMFQNVKQFIKDVGAKTTEVFKASISKETWQNSIQADIFQQFNALHGKDCLIIILAALLLQALLAWTIRAGFFPFFSKIDKGDAVIIRTLLSCFGFLVFAFAAKEILPLFKLIQPVKPDLIWGIFGLQLLLLTFRSAITLKIVPVEEHIRGSVYGFFLGMCTLVFVGYYVQPILFVQSSTLAESPIEKIFASIWIAIIIIATIKYRQVIEGILFRKDEGGSKRFLSKIEHALSGIIHLILIGFILLAFFAWFIGNQDVYLYARDQLITTFGVLFVLSTISSITLYSFNGLTFANETKERFQNQMYRLLDILGLVAIIYIFYRWVTPIFTFYGYNTSGFSDKMVGISLVIILMLLSFQGINRIFNSQLLVQESNRHFKTLLPLLDKIIKLVIFIIALLLVLSELNMDITPILASVSILGIGLGLGSKTIIEDFLNGVFIIQENDFSIGDKVIIGGVSGTIENITLRKVHLRDAYGFLNFIPFRSISQITNKSRNFNIEHVLIPLPSNFGLKQTVAILEEVGADLLKHATLSSSIITPPKFQGISEFSHSENPQAQVYGIMNFEIKVMPEKSKEIGQEFRRLALVAFEEMSRVKQGF